MNPAVSSEHCHQDRDGHQEMRSYVAYAPPAALASCAQRVVFKIATLIYQSLYGNALGYLADCPLIADARVRQLRSADIGTLVVSWTQQFWRQDLCRCRTTSLEQSASKSQTMWFVIQPVQAVTEDIFNWTVRSWCNVNCFNCTK